MKIPISIAFCIALTSLMAQTNVRNYKFTNLNSVQIEAFGQGSTYSLKYERLLINKPVFKTAASAGGSHKQFEHSGYSG